MRKKKNNHMKIKKAMTMLCAALAILTVLPEATVHAADAPVVTTGPDKEWGGSGSTEFEIGEWAVKPTPTKQIKVKVQIVYRTRAGVLVPISGLGVSMSDILADGTYATPFDGVLSCTDDQGYVEFTIKDYPKNYMVHVGKYGSYPGGSYKRWFYQEGQIEQIILYEETATPSPSPDIRPTDTPRPAATAAPTVTIAPAATAKPVTTPKPTASETPTAAPTDSPDSGTTPTPDVTENPEPTQTPGLVPTDSNHTGGTGSTGGWAQHAAQVAMIPLLLIYTMVRLRRIGRHIETIGGIKNLADAHNRRMGGRKE